MPAKGRDGICLKVGYDEKYSYLSQGTCLLNEAIKRYYDDKLCKTINLMSDYKTGENYKPSSMDVFSIQIFNRSIAGWSLFALGRHKGLKTLLKKYAKFTF